MKFRILSQRIAALLALAALLTGCSRQSKISRHLQRADSYFAGDQYDKAEIEYLNVLKLDATNRLAIRNLGAIYYSDELMLRATAFLNTAKQLDPNDLGSRSRLSRLYLIGDAAKEARQEADFVLQSWPTNETALLVLVDLSSKPDDVKALRQKVAALRQKAGDHAIFPVINGYLNIRETNFSAAEAEFKAAVALDPKSALAQWALGNHYLAQTNLALAEPALKAAADLSPVRSPRRLKPVALKLQARDYAAAAALASDITSKAPDYVPAWVYAARIALADKKLDQCEAALKRVLTRSPENFEGLSIQAEMFLAQSKPDKALASLEKLATRFPKHPGVRYQIAIASLLNKDVSRAISSLTQAVAADPNFNEAILLLAELHTRKGDTPLAVATLNDLLKREPANDRALLTLARAHQAAGKLDDATAVYKRMIQLFPKNPQPQFLLGVTLRQQGKNDEARKLFESVLQNQPENTAAITQLVEIDASAKQFDAAIKRAQAWIDKSPKDPEPLFLMAKIRFAQNDVKQTQALLEKVIELNNEAVPAYLMLANLYYTSKQVDTALEKLEIARSKNPRDSSSLLLTGMIYSEKGDFNKARDAYESLLAVAPQNIIALNNLANIYAERLNNLDKAYPLARKAEELRPKDPMIVDTFAWILTQRGEYGLALDLLKQAVQAKPTDPEILSHLGLTHYLVGEEVPARAALVASLKMSPAFTGRTNAVEALAVMDVNPTNADDAKIKLLEARLAARPTDAVAFRRLTAVYEKAGQSDKIVAASERALAANPKMAPALAKLAEVNAGPLNNPAKALELAKNARKLAPEDPEVAYVAGKIASRSSNLNDQQWAAGLLQEVSRKHDNNAAVLYELAWAQYGQGRIGEAEASMKAALTAGLDNASTPAARQFLAFIPLQDPARATQAKAQIDQALKADPAYIPALVAYAAVARKNGDRASAVAALSQVVTRYPGFGPALKDFAILSADQPADAAKALAAVNRARELYPADPELARAQGIILYQRADYSRAVRPLADSVKKYPTDASLRFFLGMTHYHLKANAESKAELNKALELQSNGPFVADAKKVLAELK
jgi:tetratricopeptide (TPR) repeat protein